MIFMKIFFYLILFCFIASNSFALDREAKARQLYVESSLILKNEGCSTVHFITSLSKSFVFINENNEITNEQNNIIIKFFNCLDLYKTKVLPINELLINEFPDTEAAFQLVSEYYLSKEEVNELETLIINIIESEDLPPGWEDVIDNLQLLSN